MTVTVPSTTTPTNQRAPHLEVTWTDPVSGRKGYLVIDKLVRGVCAGGLRMRDGCTLDEVRGLAAGMTLKEGLHFREDNRYVPAGGAKGGIDVSPHDPDARGVLTRYLQGIRVLLERHWTFGEDLGLRQQTIDDVAAEIGLRSTMQAVFPLLDDEHESLHRLESAFKVDVAGVSLDQLVGGLGVAESTLAALDRLGRPRAGTRVVIQGFGSMGGATARYLAEAGLTVVGIVDADGVVANPDGLEVERLLLSRDEFGRLDRAELRQADEVLPVEDWLKVPTDVVIPAAVSYCITPENQADVSAYLIVEAANMPVLREAEEQLRDRGTLVVPDFLANSATNAWWWWTLFGDIQADADDAFAKVRTEMRRLTDEVFDAAGEHGVSLRDAALEIARGRLADIDDRHPA